MTIRTIKTTAFEDQAPGTSGLRRRTRRFMQGGYLENFVQSIFDAMAPHERGTLVLGGDGRYHNAEAARVIVRMAAANGFSRVVVGAGALLSTPAASALIRALGADGGIVLSASHNPGGPDADFGVKFNNASGAPAPASLTRRIHEGSRRIEQYHIVDDPGIDLERVRHFTLGALRVDVVDPVDVYEQLMQRCFDFDRLRRGFAEGRLSVCFDAMHAVTGPYARRILEQSLGATPGSVINATPLSDFGGGHPDPNLAHAATLVRRMREEDAPVLGAASDGDGDRNLLLGQGFFVGPSDSLAVLAANARMIPQFAAGLAGVARSMPTSRAVDHVAAALDIPCFETPTGWKYFGNLLDAGSINLCGEESFGTGGDHVREKDGLWTVLAWLSVLEASNRSVEALVKDHWHRHGRHVYCRHDYEGLDTDAARAMMSALVESLPSLPGTRVDGRGVEGAGEFHYHDPVDGTDSGPEGVQVRLDGGGRIVYRLSGTGTRGATLRVYLEQFRDRRHDVDALRANAPLGRVAATIAGITRFTGRRRPTVRT